MNRRYSHEKIIEMIKDRRSSGEIARVVKCSTGLVFLVARKHGLKVNSSAYEKTPGRTYGGNMRRHKTRDVAMPDSLELRIKYKNRTSYINVSEKLLSDIEARNKFLSYSIEAVLSEEGKHFEKS